MPFKLQPILRAFKLIVTALFLSACGGVDEPVFCTTEVRSSVALTLVDESGSPLAAVSVTYRVDGGTLQTQVCAAPAVCGVADEVRGVFAITASKPGYTSASGSVAVTGDVCHVTTQKLTLVLHPVKTAAAQRGTEPATKVPAAPPGMSLQTAIQAFHQEQQHLARTSPF